LFQSCNDLYGVVAPSSELWAPDMGRALKPKTW